MLCISPAHCEISSSVLKSTSGFWEFGGPCVCALRAELGAWQDTPPVMESHTYQKTFQELEIGGSRGGEAASQLCPHSLCWPVFAFFIQEEGKCLIKYCALAFPHFFSVSLKKYEKCISWTVMFDRLSLISLGNEEILQLGFLTCYLAEQTDLESFGFPLPRLLEYNWSTCWSNIVLLYMGKSIIR